MDKWIKNPWFTRIVSLALALLLYTTVAIDQANTSRPGEIFLPRSSAESEVMENVPLIVDLDREDYIVRGVPDTVNVTVEGPMSVVTQTVRQRNFEVFINLNELGPGEHQVDIQHRGLSSQLSVYIEPITIDVIIEERATIVLPVDIEFVGENDFDMQELFASPPIVTPGEVEISGSTADIEKIAIVKAIVDLSDLAEDGIARNIPIKVYDTQGNELNVYIDPSTVNIEADLSVSSKDIPLELDLTGELPNNLVLSSVTMQPDTVTLFGKEERLAEITELPPLSVDLSSIGESQTVEVELLLPRGTTKMEPEVIEIVINVVEATERTFEDIEIEVVNLDDDEEITFLDLEEPVVTITVSGLESVINGLEASEIRAWIDVEDYVAGEFFVDVQLEGPEEVELSSNIERVRLRKE